MHLVKKNASPALGFDLNRGNNSIGAVALSLTLGARDEKKITPGPRERFKTSVRFLFLLFFSRNFVNAVYG